MKSDKDRPRDGRGLGYGTADIHHGFQNVQVLLEVGHEDLEFPLS